MIFHSKKCVFLSPYHFLLLLFVVSIDTDIPPFLDQKMFFKSVKSIKWTSGTTLTIHEKKRIRNEQTGFPTAFQIMSFNFL